MAPHPDAGPLHRHSLLVFALRRDQHGASGEQQRLARRAIIGKILTSTKRTVAASGLVFITVAVLAYQILAASNGSPNTLSFYDPSLVKTIDAYGPLVSEYIPRSNAESAAAGDFVETIQVPDGSEVRVLVKAPAPAQPSKILKVPRRTSRQTANEYFASAISEAISGGYAAVIFPKDVYDFAVPTPSGASHWAIKGAKDLVIDGQGSTLNFASPLSAGVTISGSQRVVFKGFNIDWPHTLMASIGTIVSINKKSNPPTMRVQIGAEYPVDASTQIIALSPWDAKTDPRNPHLSLTNFYKEEYVLNRSTVYVGNHTFQVPYGNHYMEVGDVFLVRHFGWSPWKNAIQLAAAMIWTLKTSTFTRVPIWVFSYRVVADTGFPTAASPGSMRRGSFPVPRMRFTLPTIPAMSSSKTAHSATRGTTGSTSMALSVELPRRGRIFCIGL